MDDANELPWIAPLTPPYDADTEAGLRRWMPPGSAREPLALFRTLVRHRALSEAMRPLGGTLLMRGTLPAVDRELVILRSCARCHAEYEWGVHVVAFARPLGIPEATISATRRIELDAGLPERARTLFTAVDELHDGGRLATASRDALAAIYADEQRLELLALVGFYHLISFVANGAGVVRERWAARFE